MTGMATTELTLRRCDDGYYRTSWVDDAGNRHGKSFGKDRTKARNRFARFHADWRASPSVRNPDTAPPATVRECWERFKSHADSHYRRPDGSPTGEARNIEDAFRQVLELYGDTAARDFGPKALMLARERMVEDGLCVNVINQRVRKIRHVFKWLQQFELVPAVVWHSLQGVLPLQPGRPLTSIQTGDELTVNVSEPVRPVPRANVDATLKHLPPTLQTMIRLQLLTAMRPEDVCSMRPADLETGAPVWIYRPAYHKNTYRQHERIVLLGPKAQAEVQPYLERQRELAGYLFSPLAACRERWSKCETHRHNPSDEPESERRVGNHYTTMSYARAIADACEANNLPHWSPNQLRHTALTEIRKQFGVEVAQIVAGHRKCDVTQIYAEANFEKARKIMEGVG